MEQDLLWISISMTNILLAIPLIYLGEDYWDPLTSEYLYQFTFLTPNSVTNALKNIIQCMLPFVIAKEHVKLFYLLAICPLEIVNALLKIHFV